MWLSKDKHLQPLYTINEWLRITMGDKIRKLGLIFHALMLGFFTDINIQNLFVIGSVMIRHTDHVWLIECTQLLECVTEIELPDSS